MDFTTTALLASIRRRASIPTTASTGSADSDLLAYANEEMQLSLTSDLIRVREEFFLFHSDTAISGTTYRIPKRAIGKSLRNVALLNSSSFPIQRLTRIEQEKLPGIQSIATTVGYTVENNSIVLVPSASVANGAVYLRLSYFIRPNELSQTGSQAITAVDTATNRITVSSTSGFTTSTPCDLIRGTSGFEHLAIDSTPTVVGTPSNTITFSSLPGGLAIGDYVVLAEKSPFPQIPAEFHPILAARVALRYLKAIGDRDGANDVQKDLDRMEEKAGILIAPRIEGGPKKIYSTGFVGGGNKWRGGSSGL